jgi:hypothetical protein
MNYNVILEKIAKENENKKIGIFVDMDGVIADYNFGDVHDIKNNVSGIYLNKRPINTVIEILKRVARNYNFEMYILSSCLFDEQGKEKDKWLDLNAPFFPKKNRIFTIADTYGDRNRLKIKKIEEKISSGEIDFSILIEDTHEILFLGKRILRNKIVPIHVISLID